MANLFAKFFGRDEDYYDEDERYGTPDGYGEDYDDSEEDYFDESEEYSRYNAPERTRRAPINAGNVVSMHSDSKPLVVYCPVGVDDTEAVIKAVRGHKPVIVNLEKLDTDTAQRVLDVLSGAAYALQGTLNIVAMGIYIMAPSTTTITGAGLDEITIAPKD